MGWKIPSAEATTLHISSDIFFSQFFCSTRTMTVLPSRPATGRPLQRTEVKSGLLRPGAELPGATRSEASMARTTSTHLLTAVRAVVALGEGWALSLTSLEAVIGA